MDFTSSLYRRNCGPDSTSTVEASMENLAIFTLPGESVLIMVRRPFFIFSIFFFPLLLPLHYPSNMFIITNYHTCTWQTKQTERSTRNPLSEDIRVLQARSNASDSRSSNVRIDDYTGVDFQDFFCFGMSFLSFSLPYFFIWLNG